MYINSTFKDNNATLGAVMNLKENALLHISNCRFYKNHAKEYAGAIMLFNQIGAQIENTEFHGNVARHGGALYLENHVIVEIELSVLKYNVANHGSCIRMNDKSTISIQNSSFKNNRGTLFLFLFFFHPAILLFFMQLTNTDLRLHYTLKKDEQQDILTILKKKPW